MIAPPLPENEVDRLDALDALEVNFDAPIPALQSLVEVAAELTGSPISLVSLVDENAQKFAANFGLDGVDGTPREVSFCAHAILDDAPFVVPDATTDIRFADNPLVTSAPDIKAYLGATLEPEKGKRIGALCVIDTKPREFTAEQIEIVQKLSRAATALLIADRDKKQLSKRLKAEARRNTELLELADLEPLTGLFNQAGFRKYVDATLQTFGVNGHLMFVIDVDFFKQVNDRLGHPFGDEYLRTIANGLRQTFGEDAILGRIGGDEFAAFLPVQTEDEGLRLLEELRTRLKQAVVDMGHAHLGQLSIGVSATDDAVANSFKSIYQRADIALYASKDRGRNRTTVYDVELDTEYNIRAQRARLTEALAAGQIEPFFQPILHSTSHQVSGFELLVRWRDKERGLITPGKFAKMLVDRAMAPQITNRMLRGAVEAHKTWRLTGCEGLRTGINATLYDLSDPGFIESTEWMMMDAGLDWPDFAIEVTETVMLGRPDDQVGRTMRHIRDNGGLVSLDDFGTGFAGLTHLRDWPINQLKIDQAFVRSCADSEKDRTIIRAITELAHNLGVSVVAEGVETQEVAEILTDIGCDKLQGYWFAKPMELSATIDYLVRHNVQTG